MKKSIIFGLTALALGFYACDDVEDSLSKPQTNPQLPGVEAANVPVTQGSSSFDLGSLNEAGSQAVVAEVAPGTDWPEGFTPSVPLIYISNVADFSSYVVSVEADMVDGQVLVSPDAWEEAHVKIFGTNPGTTTSYVRFPVYAVNGDQKYRMGGDDYYYGNYAVSVTPFDLYDGLVIEKKYYLLTSENGFAFDSAIEIVQGDVRYDPYDLPVFNSIFNLDGAGTQWLIIPESTYAAGTLSGNIAYGVEESGDDSLAGMLVKFDDGASANVGTIVDANPYVLSINMAQLTYDFGVAYESLYVPGGGNGWSFSTQLFTKDYVIYKGLAYLDGKFKLTTGAGWGLGVEFGASDEEGLIKKNGGDIPVPTPALYYVEVNLLKMTYQLTEISTLGIVGSATVGGWDGDTFLKPSADHLIWSATTTLTSGAFKFRMNQDWAVNLGGQLDNLWFGDSDIQISYEGEYAVVLDLSAYPYSAKIVPADEWEEPASPEYYLYVPGEANGWSQTASNPLVSTDGVYYEGYTYIKGQFKLSTAPNWNDGLNYGLKDEAISTDGDAGNFSVDKEGLYFVTFNTETFANSVTHYEKVGIIGDATAGGWDNDTFMTTENYVVWTYEGPLTGGKKFKFRFDADWGKNYGGDVNNLSEGGSDIVVEEDGNYVVTLNLSKKPYTCKVEKK